MTGQATVNVDAVPELTLDDATAFVVPCLFRGEPARLTVAHWGVDASGWKWACHVGLVREHLTVGGWRMSLSEVRLFDTAPDALAAAFATDQIGAVE